MAFDSTSYSLLKTVVMMIGEYEFEGIFTEHDDPEHTEMNFKKLLLTRCQR